MQNTRTRFRAASLALLLLVVGLILLQSGGATIVAPVSAAPGQPEAYDKVLVDADDSAALQELRRKQATLLVDYGSFELWRVPSNTTIALAGQVSSSVQPVAADFDSIILRDRVMNTQRIGLASVAADDAELAPGEQFWLVQFVGPIQDIWLDELRASGVEPVAYLPHHAYVVWGAAEALQELGTRAATQAPIQWTGAYSPVYRLHPELSQMAAHRSPNDMIDIIVQVYETDVLEQTVRELESLAVQVHQPTTSALNLTTLVLALPASEVVSLASRADVYNVEPWKPPVQLDERQGQIMAGNLITQGDDLVPEGPGYLAWLQSKGFPIDPARYPIVSIVDDGIDQGDANDVLHPDFYEQGDTSRPDRIVSLINCTSEASANNEAGHGTLNASIAGGYNDLNGFPYTDDDGYQSGLGIAPYARLAGTKVFTSRGTFDWSACDNSAWGLIETTFGSGASIVSNSWGSPSNGTYDTLAQTYDRATRDSSSFYAGNQQLLYVAAAGNTNLTPSSVNSPGTAKNVLTVGATENVRAEGIADGCGITTGDNADDIATFSARGPTSDGRAKPDLTAPGSHIQAAASFDPNYNGSGICGGFSGNAYYPPGQTFYTWSSGTSHSTPAVAGAAALLYEYYGRVLEPGANPSPAMLKALLLNTPRYLTGSEANDTLPGTAQGWGGVDLRRVLGDSSLYVSDQDILFTASGQEHRVSGTVADPNEPLHISLVWTDAPGNTTGASYVNDLDLEVTIGGNVYRGNVFAGAESVSGGSFDNKNNVENIFLPAGTSGSFDVRVIARNVAGDGVPGNADPTDQDFALVISNSADADSLFALDVVAIETEELVGNVDGVTDPGETLALSVTLQNNGAEDLNAVSGTLTVKQGAASVSSGSVIYGNIAAGATATGLSEYTVRINSFQPCGEEVVLTETLLVNGDQTLAVPIVISTGEASQSNPNSFICTTPPKVFLPLVSN